MNIHYFNILLLLADTIEAYQMYTIVAGIRNNGF